MRLVVAPDAFGGTLTAAEAAQAIADGWSRGSPEDELELVPVSDGGPGFVDVLAASLGGERITVGVRDPLGRKVTAALLLHDRTVYLETAQACGLELVAREARRPLSESTAGVGDLLAAAPGLAPDRIVAGLGGSATNDGGAGMMAALGYSFEDAASRDIPVESGPSGLRSLRRVTPPAEPWWEGDLVAATDVDNRLLGPSGATAVFGRQKGGDDDSLVELEACLSRLAQVIGSDIPAAATAADLPGSGAAGGLGYGMLVLGGRVESGCDLVLDAVSLSDRLRGAALVVTGEGSFDDQSLHGKVVSGVARRARRAGIPCIVLAGKVTLSSAASQLAATGISAAHAVADDHRSLQASLAQPAEQLARLAEQVARSGKGN